ncbi:MAG: hypothetical protein JNK05_32020 [Myxococcales bacterium]|nr:hypothetical protein [Myxococcales bacterium]
MRAALIAVAALGANACAVTRVTDIATNASGSVVHVTGARVRTLGLNALWVEQNLEWHCVRQPDERLVCRRSVTEFPPP